MYYEIGEIRTKFITVQGFKFRIKATKTQFGVFVEIMDRYENEIDSAEVNDENVGFELSQDIFEQSIYNWIERNTNEADRIMNRVMQW
ncbi:DUF1108 family protein [Staphylococcus gallinarum]|uniref:DUF1108 family protein n=1 Tax=Staphylococcus gallinarum TaxID=1293 RepID=A0A2T4SU52_STAGA|nr:DUF1108 family protein [Staphylococcus gallinarum]MCD8786672.1 DUF1108 family protein [Staphylococcus gallinarum]MCD8859283.1 DUF1108 family protein [Staphylococcus gallinarum]PTE79274.1 hypothetical protein BUY96_02300 [Staphylococcus gallinarum]PTL08042.1 hypothetical protein BUZ15_13360 [Staphylococcus gallinarum]RIL21582.1 DUF1108 family protein [Staphylococcus gallinarum]